MLANASQIRKEVCARLRPVYMPPVANAAVEHVRLRSASGGIASWSAEATPYMCQPMNDLAKKDIEAVVFMGPAQSGKTQALLDCWIAYNALYPKQDMLVIQTTGETARGYEKKRIRRLFRHSPSLKGELTGARNDDNASTKIFRSGAILQIGWPSENQLSGRDMAYVALTDHDRMPLSIAGEGSIFELAKKRSRTFLRQAMVLVESSPGFEMLDPKWKPKTPHEAPPSLGISSLYNLGNKHRYYWQCQHCKEYFLQPPGPEGMHFDMVKDLLGHVDPVLRGKFGVPCPHCGSVNEEHVRPEMKASGLWVPEGCTVEDGKVVGEPIFTGISSYWLPGAAAAYQGWRNLIQEYLRAEYQYNVTGSEEVLKTSYMQDFGVPYLPKARKDTKDMESIRDRAEDLPKRLVPPEVRFLIASVDIQKEKFVAQVHGLGEGLEFWVIDRFDIRWSGRKYRDEAAPVDPSGHVEDFRLIQQKVIQHGYRLASDPERRMNVMLTMIDTGGFGATTGNAYTFYRWMVREGLASRVGLVKGASGRQATIVRRTHVGGRGPNPKVQRGDIPLYMLDTNALKDKVDGDLRRSESGPHYIHLPDWLGKWFYNELNAEERTDKGWINTGGRRNEAVDLLCYAQAGIVVLEADRINWEAPPRWAKPQEVNPEVYQGNAAKSERAKAARVQGSFKF